MSDGVIENPAAILAAAGDIGYSSGEDSVVRATSGDDPPGVLSRDQNRRSRDQKRRSREVVEGDTEGLPGVEDVRISSDEDTLPSRRRYSSRRRRPPKVDPDGVVHDGDDDDDDPVSPDAPGDIEMQVTGRPLTGRSRGSRGSRRSLRNTIKLHGQRTIKRQTETPLTMAQRRTMRRQEIESLQKQERRSLPCCTRIFYDISMTFSRSWLRIKEYLSDLHVWSSPIREVEGTLGSGVSTYFRVLRWLLKINLINMIFALALVTTPGVFIRETQEYNVATDYNADDANCTNPDFVNGDNTFIDYANYVMQFLTGTGWMEKTALYTGWYPMANITRDDVHVTHYGCERPGDTYQCYTYAMDWIQNSKDDTYEKSSDIQQKDKIKANLTCVIGCGDGGDGTQKENCNVACDGYTGIKAIPPYTKTDASDKLSYVCFDIESYTFGSKDCVFVNVQLGNTADKTALQCNGCYRKEVMFNFPLAYVLVGLSYFALSLLWISRNVMKLFKKSALETFETNAYSHLLFVGWDYNIRKKESAIMKSKNIVKSLREQLISDDQKSRELTLKERVGIFFLRIFTNLLCLAAMASVVYLYVKIARKASSPCNNDDTFADIQSGNSTQVLANLWTSYSASIIVSLSNIVFPVFFEIIGNFERYQMQSTRINVTLIRSFIMKIFSVGSYLFIIYANIRSSAYPEGVSTGDDADFRFNCWENYIGMEMYRLVIIDFGIFVVALLMTEWLRRFIVSISSFMKEKLDISEFNISKEVLDLCYKQMLFWAALFFSPLVSVVSVLQIILMFYFKKISALRNVKPPEKVILNSSSSSIINAVFIISLMVVFIPVGFVIFTFTPSKKCGPFRNMNKFIDPVTVLIIQTGDFKTIILDNLKLTSVVVVIVVLIVIIMYYLYSLSNARSITINLLREQIRVENDDKKYLIEQISKMKTGESTENNEGVLSNIRFNLRSG